MGAFEAGKSNDVVLILCAWYQATVRITDRASSTRPLPRRHFVHEQVVHQVRASYPFLLILRWLRALRRLLGSSGLWACQVGRSQRRCRLALDFLDRGTWLEPTLQILTFFFPSLSRPSCSRYSENKSCVLQKPSTIRAVSYTHLTLPTKA